MARRLLIRARRIASSVNFFEKLNRANSALVSARWSDCCERFLSLK
jgi:hypothetical protein